MPFIAFMMVWFTFVMFSVALCAENEEANPEGFDDSFIRYVSIKAGLHRIAIQAEAVLKDKYDPGGGFGFSDWRSFGSKWLITSTMVNFWGASQDSLDVLSFGIEESIMAKKTQTSRLTFMGGLCAGFYKESESIETNRDGIMRILKDTSSSFKSYIQIGTEYELKNKRTTFFLIKYGLADSRGAGKLKEIHCIAGISFSR